MLSLEEGSKIAVIGGGPAGTLFSYFLLDMSHRVGTELQVDIFEWRNFSHYGPRGCNMCGGIISESLVQALAIEGINLPSTVVKRGVDSYVLHMDVGITRIETPLREKRIAAVHRGGGPLGIKDSKWRSFDGYLLELAMAKGANLVNERVSNIEWKEGRPQVITKSGLGKPYDLLVGAVGVNSPALDLFQGLGFGYKAPKATKTYISEFSLGQETVEKYLGSSMHVFLLNIPRLEFGAIIPKGDHATLCLLGEEIDQTLVRDFLGAPEVRQCFPPSPTLPEPCCHCSPKIYAREAVNPFADRVVLIGDSAVARLYKDGIGAAYRTAKAAAVTAMFEGISAEAFSKHYRRSCKAISIDNKFGQVVFAVTRQIQKRQFARRGVLNMVIGEQDDEHRQKRMSMVLWDTFTGSASYREVFLRTLRPPFLMDLMWQVVTGNWPLSSV